MYNYFVLGKHFVEKIYDWWTLATATATALYLEQQPQPQPQPQPYTWSMALSVVLKNSTKRGIIPVWITSSIGGFGSRDNNFLKEKNIKFFMTKKGSSIGSSLNDYWIELFLYNNQHNQYQNLLSDTRDDPYLDVQ